MSGRRWHAARVRGDGADGGLVAGRSFGWIGSGRAHPRPLAQHSVCGSAPGGSRRVPETAIRIAESLEVLGRPSRRSAGRAEAERSLRCASNPCASRPTRGPPARGCRGPAGCAAWCRCASTPSSEPAAAPRAGAHAACDPRGVPQLGRGDPAAPGRGPGAAGRTDRYEDRDIRLPEGSARKVGASVGPAASSDVVSATPAGEMRRSRACTKPKPSTFPT